MSLGRLQPSRSSSLFITAPIWGTKKLQLKTSKFSISDPTARYFGKLVSTSSSWWIYSSSYLWITKIYKAAYVEEIPYTFQYGYGGYSRLALFCLTETFIGEHLLILHGWKSRIYFEIGEIQTQADNQKMSTPQLEGKVKSILCSDKWTKYPNLAKLVEFTYLFSGRLCRPL